MFSFLRKTKQTDSSSVSAPILKKPARAAAAAPHLPESSPDEEIVVFENIDSETGSAIEEAAVYFANDMTDQARATLSQYLQDYPDRKDMQPWLMLFDLYQVQNNKPAFDDLAMQFVVRFERSAPIWKISAPLAAARKENPSQNDRLSLGSTLVGGPQLEKLCQMAQSPNTTRVDLSAVVSIELSGCKLMLEGLSGCRKRGKLVQLEGVDHFISALKKLIAKDAHGEDGRLAWLLLFEIYQWLGREAEYEEFAIEYAVKFEISPPAWEHVKPSARPTHVEAKAPLQVAAGGENGDCFSLRGVISESSHSQLQDLSNYAAGRQEIRINMAETTRVDFVAAGNVMSTLIGLTQAGKNVTILEANEMVQALFRMMGIAEFATLIRKKSH